MIAFYIGNIRGNTKIDMEHLLIQRVFFMFFY